jgi:hypothetical protein
MCNIRHFHYAASSTEGIGKSLRKVVIESTIGNTLQSTKLRWACNCQHMQDKETFKGDFA